ncbi:SRPBCC domain-containing protein [Streptomyces sp. NBC_01264]|uniref:SRPBCC domain-containing protein n=1 Tax=Streptomyces sp. NBC_01264 TaxID=2903804 RepID=UPI00225A2D0D|nr:SRPBCC domain-containing protein [Streptomyces sp. NBC_01264]MCX4781761.1 SRPBCC domain-containing protein [Streptomyces sp. NBC_01264]
MHRALTLATACAALTLLPLRPAAAAEAATDSPAPREPGRHSVVHREQAVIAAPAERIWDVLVDLPSYQDWNPWVLRADGEVRPGATVHVTVALGTHVMPAEHTVLVVEPNRRFCWRDAGWNASFVYGQRCRTLDPRADGTVLVTNELLLDGIFSSATDLVMGTALRKGLAAETRALELRAESMH